MISKIKSILNILTNKKEDEEVIMTPEELEQFLAAGGQVEYL